MSTADFTDFDYSHRLFDPALLIDVIQLVRQLFPGCSVGRALNTIGNLCVYDSRGEYVGVIELHDPPELKILDHGK